MYVCLPVRIVVDRIEHDIVSASFVLWTNFNELNACFSFYMFHGVCHSVFDVQTFIIYV